MGSLPPAEISPADNFEPVAIVGMGCRWPGDSESPSELWAFLQEKRDAYSKFPADRIKTESFYHPNGDRPGSFYTEGGCFLKSDVRNFDHTFFGIHPREVMSIDPAQRKLMEAVYEAFESGGIPMHKLAGSRTGCFVGNFNYDHQLMQYRDAEYPEPYSVTGGGITVLSNRINYIFDLKGPSMTLDTACSSSMYALHLACAAIQTGECNAAVVGGSNLILTPECQIFSTMLGAVSPTSVCHTFDAAADGYARADGIGALYIKNLSDAVRDGDPIRAIIRGTAINANGKTGGITHPSPDGQEAVIRRAYERAGGLDPSLTGYFECHGTGTAVGDPLEVSAVGRVFAGSRTSSTPLLIGSIKSNLGHSEPTSGIAGIMKAVLAIEHGVIPPTVGLKILNPNIDLKDGRLKIVTESTKWPDLPLRRASINSFGYGGANAHAIIDSVDSILPGYRSFRQRDAYGTTHQPSQWLNRSANGLIVDGQVDWPSLQVTSDQANGHSENYDSSRRVQFLLPFSAHDEKTLRQNIKILRDQSASWDLVDIAYTLSVRRSLFSYRSFAVVESSKSYADLDPESLVVTKKQGTSIPTLGFVFTGQGAQWPQMGLDLMIEFPNYLKTIRTLDSCLDTLNDGRNWTIEGVLREKREKSQIHNAELSQPLVTAIQVALVDLLASWNIAPAAVVGHSSGEIAASYAAGLITKRDAIVAAYLRGRAVARNEEEGSMLAVGLGSSDIDVYLAPLEGRAAVACYNSPESLTLSGDTAAISRLKQILDSESIFARVLSTGGNAYHSHHMKCLGQQYEDEMVRHAPRLSQKASKDPSYSAILPTRLFSSVYGQATTQKILGADYWRKNLESPVLFHQAVLELVKTVPVDALVEIGPHSALQGPLRQIAKTTAPGVNFPEYMPTMVRNSNTVTDLLALAGKLYTKGYSVDLGRVNAVESEDATRVQRGKTITDMPHYQWNYPDEAIILENRYTREWRLRMHPRHDILGSRLPGGVKAEPVWRNVLRYKDVPWLGDHRLGKQIIFPSTGYLSMGLEAATQAVEVSGKEAKDIQNYHFRDVSLQNALIVPEDDHGIETLFTMHPASLSNTTRHESRYDFLLTSVTNESGEDKFVEHCRGTVDVIFHSEGVQSNPLAAECEAATPIKKNISASQWYESFGRVGLCYGPMFQGLSKIRAAGTSNLTEARIGLRPTSKISGESRYVVHPAALDAAMQLSILASHSSNATKFKKAYMPVGMESIKIWPKAANATSDSALSIAKGVLKGIRGLSADLVLMGAQEKPIVEAKNILLIASDQTAQTLTTNKGPYTRMVWKPEFKGLNDAKIAALYPPVVLDASGVIPSLNNLALHQIIHFKQTHPDIFTAGSEVPHLQRLIDWIDQKLSLAQQDQSSSAQEIIGYSDTFREKEIARLAAALNPVSSESRLMCHIYNNLPAIYSGEKTGIQVALQDNLLIDNYESGQVYNEGNKRLASVLSLLAHGKPSLKILEVGAGTGSATREILPALNGQSPWRRYTEYRFTDTTTSFLAGAEEKFRDFAGMSYGTFDMEKPGGAQGYQPEWDVIVASNVIHATSDIKGTLLNLRSALKADGKLILLELTQSQLSAGLVLGTFSDFWKGDVDKEFPRLDGPFLSKSMWRSVLPEAGFSGLDFYLDDYAGNNVSATVICASATEPMLSVSPTITPPAAGLTMIYRNAPTPFVLAVQDRLKSLGLTVDMVALGSVDNVRFDRLLFLVELDSPLFLDATPAEWDGLKICLKCAGSALWVTSGALSKGQEPLYAMISGIARGLKTEMSSLRLCMLDLDQKPESSNSGLCDMITRFERRASDMANKDDDTEFRLKNGIIYISRLIADDGLNEQSRAKAEQQTSTQEISIMNLRSVPLLLDIDKPAVLSTLYFRKDHDFDLPLNDDHVEIEVQSAGVNNKDLAVVNGRHHSDTFSDECAGKITKVGPGVKDLKPGDSVYCQSFAKFGNFVRDKASFCQKLEPDDTFESVATMPIAFCTAIYGLMDLGRLTKGETVLIQSATGGVGLAAIQIARLCGAEIYATVGTAEKKAKLLDMDLGIAEDHIFGSRDADSARSLLQFTGQRGIDVIFCSARGEMMHEYWRCIAPCGRFVEIGRTEILDNGKLALDVFRRNATFASFDLEVMSKTRPDIISRLMVKLAELKANQLIKSLPYTAFHVSEIDKALMKFGKGAHIGKIVVSYDHHEEAGLKVRRSPFKFSFDPEAAYLLVGCLGGLGRSFSAWAVRQGARNLIYLSRTGALKVEAQNFLDTLRNQGVDARVVKGDVTSLDDVKAAVCATERPIKGVIQGALTLHDGLFESMTLENFNATVKPRVTGTLNLHSALKDSPLDFFQMWSSWTVMFGTATQSNYLSSNAFMDAFAHHRRYLGLPATSLGLSQVLGIGVVSYMPEYQQAMIRNGFYGNDEEECLQFCEAGVCAPAATATTTTTHDPTSDAHLLVGIEPAGLKTVDKKYPIDEMPWSRDPRFANLVQATHLLSAGDADGKAHDADEAGTPVERVRLKVSRLLYVPLEDVDTETAINTYGIDSMIAAELRNWLFATMEVDVSLLDLLSPTMTVRKLADGVGKAGGKE